MNKMTAVLLSVFFRYKTTLVYPSCLFSFGFSRRDGNCRAHFRVYQLEVGHTLDEMGN